MLSEFNNNNACGFIELKINFNNFYSGNKTSNPDFFSFSKAFRTNLLRSVHFQQIKTYKYLLNRPRCIYMVGLGYKNFVLNGSLFILVGDCNYLIFQIPFGIKVLCKKNQVYLIANSSILVGDFAAKLKRVKKLNMYKGKGVLEFKNFKFTKLKVGKKQKV